MSLPPGTLILAVDVGTSSVRTMIFDQQGQALDGVYIQAQYTPHTTPDGGSEIDPGALLRLIFEGIDSALAKAGAAAERIGAVVMDTLVGNLLGIGADGTSVTPVYTWADQRGREMAHALRESLDHGAYINRTGCRIHTSYWPLRLRWLAEHCSEAFKQTVYWLSLGEYAFYKIFGERRASLSMASWSGLLNRFTNDWDAQMLALLPIGREQLSALSGAPLQGLSGEFAHRWPALKEALWFPAIGDGVASNIGAGCTDTHHVALNGGTSGAMRVIVPGRPERVPDGLFAYCVDESRSLIGGALSNAGNLYDWLSRTLSWSPDLLAQLDGIVPDSHGLTVLPFLAGERAPGWNEKARTVFMGMTLDTRSEHLVRAALEAIAYRFYQIARRLEPLRAESAVYVASGAAILNSPPWMQILADVLNAPVYANLEPEATIRGAVFQASGVDSPPRLGRAYLPDPVRHAVYMEASARQQMLYDRLFGGH